MNYYNSCIIVRIYLYLHLRKIVMERRDWNLWNNITFKTLGYRKNFDFISANENIITLYDGMISEMRLSKKIPPRPVGEYSFSVWNIDLGKKLNINLEKLIKEHDTENSYYELFDVIKKNVINVRDYKKIVVVHTLVLNEDYRKRGITEEFVEMLYRDFYSDDVAIIMLVKPFQDNPIDADFYFNRKAVLIKDSLNKDENTTVSAKEYYGLDALTKKTDIEINEYKLFSVAHKCGFQRINESYLFLFTPEKIEGRMLEKQEFSQQVETE